MIDPYQVLEVDRDADEETIRRRYLELVRRYPPEREPVRFAEIRNAYDSLRDPIARLEKRLFQFAGSESIADLASQLLPDLRSRRLPTEVLLSLARS